MQQLQTKTEHLNVCSPHYCYQERRFAT